MNNEITPAAQPELPSNCTLTELARLLHLSYRRAADIIHTAEQEFQTEFFSTFEVTGQRGRPRKLVDWGKVDLLLKQQQQQKIARTKKLGLLIDTVKAAQRNLITDAELKHTADALLSGAQTMLVAELAIDAGADRGKVVEQAQSVLGNLLGNVPLIMSFFRDPQQLLLLKNADLTSLPPSVSDDVDDLISIADVYSEGSSTGFVETRGVGFFCDTEIKEMYHLEKFPLKAFKESLPSNASVLKRSKAIKTKNGGTVHVPVHYYEITDIVRFFGNAAV
jgi:hypothetical protein